MRAQKRVIIVLAILAMLLAVSPALAVEAGDSPLDALGINVGFLLAQLVNFGLIFAALLVFLWRPMTRMLDNRAAEIERGLEDAAAAANARRNAEAEAEKILAEARSEASKLVEEARGRGDEVAQGIQTEAREEAERIRQDARTSAQAERNAELANLRNQVVAISVAMTERLVGASVDEKRQQELVNNFLTNLPESARGMGGDVEVISAMPLSDEEQNRVKSEVSADNATFTVDPNILGGLIIRSDDRVVDGSVRSGLSDMSARMN